MTRLRWTSDTTTETAVVSQSPDGWHVEALVQGTPAVRYSVTADRGWATRAVRVATTERSLELLGDGRGGWTDGEGRPLPRLDGALDVDISATPLTNTLAIARLGLPVGTSAEIVTAYVAVPELTTAPDPQRYTRLGEHLYRFESLDSDFTREIEVDDDGFVVEYPGLFRRA